MGRAWGLGSGEAPAPGPCCCWFYQRQKPSGRRCRLHAHHPTRATGRRPPRKPTFGRAHRVLQERRERGQGASAPLPLMEVPPCAEGSTLPLEAPLRGPSPEGVPQPCPSLTATSHPCPGQKPPMAPECSPNKAETLLDDPQGPVSIDPGL